MKPISHSEHLFELYPFMPRYANDPEESEVIKAYDHILRRFQGYYGKSPTYFVKASACMNLLGDMHDYVGFEQVSFCSSQNVVVAIAKNTTKQIRINNFQSAVYGEKILSANHMQWKFDQEEDRMYSLLQKCLTTFINENLLKEISGFDILVYADFIEDQFARWKEALTYAFYSAVHTAFFQEKLLDNIKIEKIIKKIRLLEPSIEQISQMTNYKYANFSFQGKGLQKDNFIEFSKQYTMVAAHSMTPQPKKLIQGKRFNLRRCQVLLAIQYLKTSNGINKDIRSIKQLIETIGCTAEELLQSVEEFVPKDRVTAEDVENTTERTLIEILKQVPFANNVIDQNVQFFPYNRISFFLKEYILLSKLNADNLIEVMKQSSKNQAKYLQAGSDQIEQMIKIGAPYSKAYRIIGSGWGGNVLFICQKKMGQKLMQDLINNFYLTSQNKILLSDDIQQYIHEIETPCTGLMILNPQNEIWY